MEFDLSDDLRALRSRAREFVDRYLIPNERDLSQGHRLSTEDRGRLEAGARELDLWNVNVPSEFGGPGYGLLARTVIYEELGRSIALPPRNRGVMGPEVSPILLRLTEPQRERFLYPVLRGETFACFAQTEPGAGGDPAAMETTAVLDGDVYVVNGTKRFIGFVDETDFVQLFASTDRSKGARGVTAFVVPLDIPGIGIVRQMQTMMRDRPFEIAFDNLRIPVENRVGDEGAGFAYAQSWITEGRILRHAARAIGVIERCLELGTAYALARTTFGAPLAQRQSIQWMLVDMYLTLKQLRLMTYQTALRYDRGEDVRHDSYMCKYFGDESSFTAADRCMQIHGGIGLTTDFPIETFWRDQRSFTITEGPTEILKMTLARHVLERYAPR
jgi:acyl-CoA dehydrogenase